MTSAFAHFRKKGQEWKGKKKGSCPTNQELLIMEVIVTLVRLIYHDAASIGLKLEVANAVLLNVSHYIGEHTLDEVGTDTSRVVLLAAQPLGYVPDKVP